MSLIVRLCSLVALLLAVDGLSMDIFEQTFPGEYDGHPEITKYKETFNSMMISLSYKAILGKTTKDDLADLLSQLIADFLTLPIEDQKLLGNVFEQDVISTKDKFKNSAYMETLIKKINQDATRELLKEATEKFDWLTETNQALEYIKEKDAELATLLEIFIQDGKDHFNKLESQEAKDFFKKLLSAAVPSRGKKVTIEALGPVHDEYLKLTAEQRKNLIRNMFWLFIDPVAESIQDKFVELKEQHDNMQVSNEWERQ